MTHSTTHDIGHDKDIIPLLKSCNNRISKALKTAAKEQEEIKDSFEVDDAIVYKLEKMDRMKVELQKLRTFNAQMNVLVTSATRKAVALQEELLSLHKVRERAEKEHSKLAKKRNVVVGLRAKILPKAKLHELKTKLTEESAGLENISGELGWLKNEVPPLIQKKKSLKEELEQTLERIPLAQEQVTSHREKIERLSPKVTTEDEVKSLEEEVRALRPKKENLTQENKEISPRIASIKEEEEKSTSVLEAYRQKNQKDRDKISELEKVIKEMDVDADKLVKLKENLSSIEAELGVKKENLEKLKPEYSDALKSNQSYNAIIKEVDEGTEQLKNMLDK